MRFERPGRLFSFARSASGFGGDDILPPVCIAVQKRLFVCVCVVLFGSRRPKPVLSKVVASL